MKDIVSSFPGIIMEEETHTYKKDGRVIPSVSSCLTNFYPKFDPNLVKYSAKKQNKSVSQLQAEWDKAGSDACIKGTSIHTFAEDYQVTPIRPTKIEELAVIQWYMDLPEHQKVQFIECRIYFEDYYAGTFDKLIYDESDDTYILSDWKTNKDLLKDYGKKMYAPFDHLVSNNLHKYYLQLNHYALALKEKGFKIKEMKVVHLKPHQEDFPTLYKSYDVPDYTDILKQHYLTNDHRNYSFNN